MMSCAVGSVLAGISGTLRDGNHVCQLQFLFSRPMPRAVPAPVTVTKPLQEKQQEAKGAADSVLLFVGVNDIS